MIDDQPYLRPALHESFSSPGELRRAGHAGPARVAVIGAGASGLASAYEPQRHGLDALRAGSLRLATRITEPHVTGEGVRLRGERHGVFIRDAAGGVIGAVGVTGAATSSEDERAAVAGIEAAGPSADTGEV
ncbi:hypothetical protein [Nocardia asiatica]|uniref:hypothetical protein n=1 Tax=Nocardia asiatica TaxID=209252 RepID=UPI002455CC60|nr:hypothetical protein [Nocardia asiatica]